MLSTETTVLPLVVVRLTYLPATLAAVPVTVAANDNVTVLVAALIAVIVVLAGTSGPTITWPTARPATLKTLAVLLF